jgi:hypothetical protein
MAASYVAAMFQFMEGVWLFIVDFVMSLVLDGSDSMGGRSVDLVATGQYSRFKTKKNAVNCMNNNHQSKER